MVVVEVQELRWAVLVTVMYLVVYYLFVCHVALTKRRLLLAYREAGEQFDRYFGEDREMLAADRVQLNTLEQMVPFLAAMWMFTIFVDAYWGAVLGAAYAALRAIYPLVMGTTLGAVAPRALIYISTLPQYGLLVYFAGAVVHKLFA